MVVSYLDAAGEPIDLLNRDCAAPVHHRVDVTPLGPWLIEQLAFDPRAGVGTADWLATPTQWLAEITAGAVFHDGDGELTAVRNRLSWYPDEVWWYVLASQWARWGRRSCSSSAASKSVTTSARRWWPRGSSVT